MSLVELVQKAVQFPKPLLDDILKAVAATRDHPSPLRALCERIVFFAVESLADSLPRKTIRALMNGSSGEKELNGKCIEVLIDQDKGNDSQLKELWVSAEAVNASLSQQTRENTLRVCSDLGIPKNMTNTLSDEGVAALVMEEMVLIGTEKMLEMLTVALLKEVCAVLRLKVTGKKQQLVHRVLDCIYELRPVEERGEQPKKRRGSLRQSDDKRGEKKERKPDLKKEKPAMNSVEKKGPQQIKEGAEKEVEIEGEKEEENGGMKEAEKEEENETEKELKKEAEKEREKDLKEAEKEVEKEGEQTEKETGELQNKAEMKSGEELESEKEMEKAGDDITETDSGEKDAEKIIEKANKTEAESKEEVADMKITKDSNGLESEEQSKTGNGQEGIPNQEEPEKEEKESEVGMEVDEEEDEEALSIVDIAEEKSNGKPNEVGKTQESLDREEQEENGDPVAKEKSNDRMLGKKRKRSEEADESDAKRLKSEQ